MRVLLVEDHQMLRQGLRLLCERQGNWCVVGEAEDCPTAIELTRREQPDILLLDLILADGSVMDCLPRLRESFAGSIVVLTGAEDPGIHRLAREHGADGVIVKGAEPQVLFATIDKIMTQKEQPQSDRAIAA